MPMNETDDIEVEIRAIELRPVLDEVASTCRSLVTANGNEFVIDLPQTLGQIQSDETKIRQIMINLLSNAGKFTRNGTVTVRAQRGCGAAGDEIVMSVQDTGIGIAPDIIEQLFVEFNQASAHTSRLHGGTGLGLAVCRKLCERLNGGISVASREGEGSTFTVRIPATAAAEELPAAA